MTDEELLAIISDKLDDYNLIIATHHDTYYERSKHHEFGSDDYEVMCYCLGVVEVYSTIADDMRYVLHHYDASIDHPRRLFDEVLACVQRYRDQADHAYDLVDRDTDNIYQVARLESLLKEAKIFIGFLEVYRRDYNSF